MTSLPADDLLMLTADIVTAHSARGDVAIAELPGLIATVHAALEGLGRSAPTPEPPRPAVPVRGSVRPDHIVCLEDGRRLKVLTRHLRARYGLSPEQYRTKWGLPADYPMVAPAVAEARRQARQPIETAGEAEPVSPKKSPAENAPNTADPQPAADPAPAPAAETAPAESGRRTLKPVFRPDGAARRTLSLAPPDDVAGAPPPVEQQPETARALELLRIAVARKLCVRATYNKQQVTLAPYLVFTRHDEPYLRAVTVERGGKRPRELKLGTFKLVGLGDLDLTPDFFTPLDGLDAPDPELAGSILCSI